MSAERTTDGGRVAAVLRTTAFARQLRSEHVRWRGRGVDSRSSGRIALYGGGGVTWLRPRFQVGFTDANGITDATRVEVNLVRGAVFAGLTARLTRAFDVSGSGVRSATGRHHLSPRPRYRLR